MFTTSSGEMADCIRCGTCCRKGGPVLHHQDKDILRVGRIGYDRLVTLRRGERAYNPVKDVLEPIPEELIKLAGNGKDWGCFFYNEAAASCAIYGYRPVECRLLKCWDTSAVRSLLGRNTLRRADIINSGDPVLELIAEHERECPCCELERFIRDFGHPKKKTAALSGLKELVHNDMSLRVFAFRELELRREFELFIFGRPVSQILKERGLKVTMNKGDY